MTKETDFSAEILDVSDLIERFEELETTRDAIEAEWTDNADNAGLDFLNYVRTDVRWGDDEEDEYKTLSALLDELKGNGGDEQWRGDWYPTTLVSDSYFIAYTQEMLEDCGYIPKDFPNWIAIDWEKTAEAVRTDYTYVSIDGWVFWYR